MATKERAAQQIPVWLIEAAWSRQQPAYLATTRGTGGYFFEWSFNPHGALKFADRDSAEQVCMAVREKAPELFPSIVPFPQFTEHVFINGVIFPKPQ